MQTQTTDNRKRRLVLDDQPTKPSVQQGNQQASTLRTTASPAARREVAPTTTTDVVAKPVLSNVQENETVAGQLKQITASGSPLLKQSRDRAVTYAAGRGLQNSTLAAQAGEAALIDAALPIASQDAATFSNRSLVNVDTQNRFGLQEQGGNINSRLQKEQGTIASRLQREQGNINSRLQKEQGEIRQSEIKLQGQIEERLVGVQFQNQQSLMATDFANQLRMGEVEGARLVERMNLQHRQTLEQIEVNAGAQTRMDSAAFSRQLGGAYLTSVTNRQSQASAEVQQIYSTQGLSSAQQQAAVSNAYARMQSDLRALGAYYSTSPAWDDSWATPGGNSSNSVPVGMAPPQAPFQQPVARNPGQVAQDLLAGFLRRGGARP